MSRVPGVQAARGAVAPEELGFESPGTLQRFTQGLDPDLRTRDLVRRVHVAMELVPAPVGGIMDRYDDIERYDRGNGLISTVCCPCCHTWSAPSRWTPPFWRGPFSPPRACPNCGCGKHQGSHVLFGPHVPCWECHR